MQLRQDRKRFVLLDTMRGYAACIVMTLHYGYLSGATAFTLRETNAYMAVDFFFLLSGFVLAHAYFSKPTFNFFKFAQARFARLYPLHFATFVVTVILFSILGFEFTDGEFILHLFMVHNIGLGPPRAFLNYPAWSISIEFWTNVLLGLVVVAAFAKAPNRLVLNAILLVIGLVCQMLLFVFHGNLEATAENLMPLVNLGVLRGLSSIAFGIVLYDVYRWINSRYGDATHAALQILTPIALLVFLFVMFLPIYKTRIDFLILPVLAAVLLVAAFETGPVARFAEKFEILGRISFSIYLTHVPIQQALHAVLVGSLSYTAIYFIQFAAVLAISYLTFKYYEVPSYAWGKAFLRSTGDRLVQTLTRFVPVTNWSVWRALSQQNDGMQGVDFESAGWKPVPVAARDSVDRGPLGKK